MEIHRLKPMQDGYDEQVFNRLYEETENLRRYLTYQIDARRYGVSQDIIKSWFDDKFIFVFNKHCHELEEGVLKGYIINALKTFKFRMLRKAYNKYNIHGHEVRLEGENELINIIPLEEEISDHNLFLEMALKYLKTNLCDDAYLVLNLELNPPPYILDKINNPKTKIPAKLIAEYLDLESNQDSIGFINDLRAEVKFWTLEARDHFKQSSATLIQ